jgi:hypothetical protein
LPSRRQFKAVKKKLAKPCGSTVQSLAEALKPEHGLETLAIKILEQASAVCFSVWRRVQRPMK